MASPVTGVKRCSRSGYHGEKLGVVTISNSKGRDVIFSQSASRTTTATGNHDHRQGSLEFRAVQLPAILGGCVNYNEVAIVTITGG